MKAVVAAFNQEKALVGAFSVITNLRMELFWSTSAQCPAGCSGRDLEMDTHQHPHWIPGMESRITAPESGDHAPLLSLTTMAFHSDLLLFVTNNCSWYLYTNHNNNFFTVCKEEIRYDNKRLFEANQTQKPAKTFRVKLFYMCLCMCYVQMHISEYQVLTIDCWKLVLVT